jgi:hypothetical protein
MSEVEAAGKNVWHWQLVVLFAIRENGQWIDAPDNPPFW